MGLKNSRNRSKTRIHFNRDFFGSGHAFTFIGSGKLGGKAGGLAFIHDILAERFNHRQFPGITVNIPTSTILTTSLFDAFMKRNQLYTIALSDESDDRIAHAFQRADFPAEYIGDIRALIAEVRTPLAVRSSSLLEDAMFKPFAGVYATKMISNNHFETDIRFRKLIEAIKFVWASTFFKEAKGYIATTDHSIEEEKMAVIIQEVVGSRHLDRFYPEISGVARSFNFYPVGRAKPEQGVVSLALGLGKTIVDGGICWSFSPALPKVNPPVSKISELLKLSQLDFWAVNMGNIPQYDPIKETEYMVKEKLDEAEKDGTLKYLASTYSIQSDRLSPGIGADGARVLTFAPLLVLNQIPLNSLIKALLDLCEEALNYEVEIEFAMTIDPKSCSPARFGFLQVRPMVVSSEQVEVSESDLHHPNTLVASTSTLGNGESHDIHDIVFVRPDNFEAKFTPSIAQELEHFNGKLRREGRHYLLIGLGRWGSSDPWLGIPVNWSQISGAKVMVEATLPTMNVDFSQGSHFFHNLTSFQVSYFFVHHNSNFKIGWDWLEQQTVIEETHLVRHVRLSQPLQVKVDGRSGKGVIHHG